MAKNIDIFFQTHEAYQPKGKTKLKTKDSAELNLTKPLSKRVYQNQIIKKKVGVCRHFKKNSPKNKKKVANKKLPTSANVKPLSVEAKKA